MRKNTIFIILLALFCSCCTTSLKNIEIRKLFFWLADIETKQIAEAVIPGQIYQLLAAVRTAEGEDIYDVKMNEFSFSSPDQSLAIIHTRYITYVRVRPDSFVFIKEGKCVLRAEVPSHKYAEVVSWPIDWDHYTKLDFSPDTEASADILNEKEITARVTNLGIRRRNGRSVDFDCAYYEIMDGDKARTYIILYERNMKALYALRAAKKITLKSNGRDGRDGEDGEPGEEGEYTKDGEDGEDGEDGGNAGNITATYYHDSDIDKFLTLKARGGRGGEGGSGGEGYDDGEAGQTGINGSRGRDGQIKEYRRQSFIDMFDVEGYPEFDRNLLRFYY